MQTLHETLMPFVEKVKFVPLSDLENESFKKQQQQILSLFGHIMTDILILIGSLRCIKEAKLMDMVLDNCIFQNRFP